jgi:tetratricopeptide (TPR) repeat protein
MRCFYHFRAPFIVALFVFLGTIHDVNAQGFSLQINGQVRFADSRAPAPNVMVRLESTTGGMVNQIITDRMGKFSFTNLRGEQYMVTVHAYGYREYQERVDLNTAVTAYVNAVLERDKEQATDTSMLGVISAQIPPEAQNELAKGKQLIDDNKIAEGIAHLEKAIALDPQYLDAQVMLGLAQMDLKHWDKAEKAFLEAIRINPQASTAYFAGGDLYRRQKKYTEGEKMLLEGLKIQPDSPQGHATLAELYWEMAPGSQTEQLFRSRLETSWKEVDTALKLNPSMPQAQLLAGNLLLKARRPQDALKHFEEYLRLDPNGPFAAEASSMVEKIKQAMAQGQKKQS